MADYVLNAEMGKIGAGGFTPKVFHMKIPDLPRFRFEWLPEKQIVYAITIGILPEMAEPISTHVIDEEQALRVVNTWAHGFSTAIHFGPD
jgi:hypothetical protein